eukprot:scaffold868_cov249-Pinguiococcus_pyrenoidosus.AAC.13
MVLDSLRCLPASRGASFGHASLHLVAPAARGAYRHPLRTPRCGRVPGALPPSYTHARLTENTAMSCGGREVEVVRARQC